MKYEKHDIDLHIYCDRCGKEINLDSRKGYDINEFQAYGLCLLKKDRSEYIQPIYYLCADNIEVEEAEGPDPKIDLCDVCMRIFYEDFLGGNK